jgi:hypothetical protein
MSFGHMIYLGNDESSYLTTYSEETDSFAQVQGVDITLWNDEMIVRLIKNNFTKDVLSAYISIKPYPFKSDLARLCILYVFGGWYSDLGIRFVKKIIPDKNIILFEDKALEKMFGYDYAIQNAIIYSKPKQEVILHCIKKLAQLYNNKVYGADPAAIGGPVQMGAVFKNFAGSFGLGEMGRSFTNADDLKSGKTNLKYFYKNTHVANFKDFKKKNTLHGKHPERVLWGLAWEQRSVY